MESSIELNSLNKSKENIELNSLNKSKQIIKKNNEIITLSFFDRIILTFKQIFPLVKKNYYVMRHNKSKAITFLMFPILLFWVIVWIDQKNTIYTDELSPHNYMNPIKDNPSICRSLYRTTEKYYGPYGEWYWPDTSAIIALAPNNIITQQFKLFIEDHYLYDPYTCYYNTSSIKIEIFNSEDDLIEYQQDIEYPMQYDWQDDNNRKNFTKIPIAMAIIFDEQEEEEEEANHPQWNYKLRFSKPSWEDPPLGKHIDPLIQGSGIPRYFYTDDIYLPLYQSMTNLFILNYTNHHYNDTLKYPNIQMFPYASYEDNELVTLSEYIGYIIAFFYLLLLVLLLLIYYLKKNVELKKV